MSETEALSAEAIVEGLKLTTDHAIVGALVKRLGGKVELTIEEINAVKGVSSYPDSHLTVIIEAE